MLHMSSYGQETCFEIKLAIDFPIILEWPYESEWKSDELMTEGI